MSPSSPMPPPVPLAPPWPPPEERRQGGKAIRRRVPRETHGAWKPEATRRDLIELLIQSNRSRIPELVPIRYGRMLASPSSFLRGSAIVMAADLVATPVTGFRAQLCGDAHLLNFGVFASPERHLLFDINDFDETLPGPWEWDLKRLVVSFAVAARARSFRDRDGKEAARACA